MAWEYKTVQVGAEGLAAAETRLNVEGADNWELVCIEKGYFIFKKSV
jgi:hypothetical protein